MGEFYFPPNVKKLIDFQNPAGAKVLVHADPKWPDSLGSRFVPRIGICTTISPTDATHTFSV